ncbi:MAG: DUF2871 domain-containing protein [Nocardiaceae bacterium]|nr:DUF2871 domain-containing protein [Nocardiaceae bacterium]
MVAVKTLVNAAFGYVILGLLSGFYYRELTKAHDFDGRTQLATVHTHLLVLGVVFLLVVLALEKMFTLSTNPMYRWFTITFHAGVIVTVAMMTVHGTMQVLDKEVSPAISGIAGLGHILLTVAFVLFFLTLRSAVTTPAQPAVAGEEQQPVS